MGRRGWNTRRDVCRIMAVCAVVQCLTTGLATGAAFGDEWVTTGPPIEELATAGRLVGLPDGTALVFGLIAARVQEYQPHTGEWVERGSLREARGTGATVTVITRDSVLLAGGTGSAAATAEVYDRAAGTSTPTASMHFARAGHQA